MKRIVLALLLISGAVFGWPLSNYTPDGKSIYQYQSGYFLAVPSLQLTGDTLLPPHGFQSQQLFYIGDATYKQYLRTYNIVGDTLLPPFGFANPDLYYIANADYHLYLRTFSAGSGLIPIPGFSVPANITAFNGIPTGSLGYSSAFGTHNNLVSRDSNGNTHTNNFESRYTTNASSGTIQITAASSRLQTYTTLGGCTLILPDARKLLPGHIFEINNNSISGTITIKTNDSVTTVATLAPLTYGIVTLTVNNTRPGGWDIHWLMPSNYNGIAVTSVASGFGLTGGPITHTGTLSVDTTGGNLYGARVSSQFAWYNYVNTIFAGSTHITTLGTITTGTWNGSIIQKQYVHDSTIAAGTNIQVSTAGGNRTISTNAQARTRYTPYGDLATDLQSTSWTTHGGKWKFLANGTVRDSAGAVDFSVYMTYTKNNLQSDGDMGSIDITFVDTAAGPTSFGLAAGWRSNNAFGSPFSIVGRVNLSNAAGKGTLLITGFRFDNGVLSTITSSSAGVFNWTQGDTLVYAFTRVRDLFKLSVYNKTTKTAYGIQAQANVYTYPSPAGAFTPYNTSSPVIYNLGGTHAIARFRYTSFMPDSCDVAIIGDSKVQGWFDGERSNTLQYILNPDIDKTAVFAGGGDVTDNAVNDTLEVKLLHPRLILIMVGCNDTRQSIAVGTTEANWDRLWKTYKANGDTVIFCTIVPEQNNLNFTTLNTYIRSHYPNNYIELYNGMLANGSTTILSTRYAAGDLIHNNDFAMYYEKQQILNRIASYYIK